MSVIEVILVRVFSPECGKTKTRITPNTKNFYAVFLHEKRFSTNEDSFMCFTSYYFLKSWRYYIDIMYITILCPWSNVVCLKMCYVSCNDRESYHTSNVDKTENKNRNFKKETKLGN